MPLLGELDPDAPVISFSSLSKAYLAPGWRTGWLVAGTTPRLNDALAAMKKLADGRLCSPGPMQHAVAAAIEGDRSHQVTFRAALAERGRISTKKTRYVAGSQQLLRSDHETAAPINPAAPVTSTAITTLPPDALRRLTELIAKPKAKAARLR